MKNYGLIGNPIKHSFSPDYFKHKFEKLGLDDCSYDVFEVKDLTGLKKLAIDKKLNGFNVTIPFKKEIIPFLHHISKSAKKIGAVNTVTIRDGKWYGGNTDHTGFRKSIKKHLKKNHKSALIFGNGGSALAVKYSLKKLGINFTVVSSSGNGDIGYSDVTSDMIANNLVLVNTTPLGSLAHLDECVDIPYEALTKNHICFDLVYTPSETRFLNRAKQQNATIKNGIQMLEIQADKSWKIWNT